MDYAERTKLEDAVKTITLYGLNKLVDHHIKGADLMKKAALGVIGVVDELNAHQDELRMILQILKPVLDVAREWLVQAYQHLVALFDWAKAKCRELFG